jgi:hypothetical protein
MFVSTEIRWFYPDECPANLHRWFGEMSPALGGGKLRIDEYLSQTNQSEVMIIQKRDGFVPMTRRVPLSSKSLCKPMKNH